jgi:hypothetical protein|tara:strand:+ start:1024 stop:1710 length:687 start_codon:yes stop_codon:yes gene_type:complete
MSWDIPSDTRNEFKFVTDSLNYHKLREWLLNHSQGFLESFPSRKINNVYFDTHDLKAYKDNLFGSSSRVKLRYRWYGNKLAPDQGNLELKCKKNRIGWKFRHEIKKLEFGPGVSWRNFRGQIRNQLPPDWKIHLDSRTEVVLINRYWRDYFKSRDGKVLVNLDTKQSIAGQFSQLVPSLNSKDNFLDSVVLEVKSSWDDYDLTHKFMQNLPLSWSRHSKYIVGVNSLR